MPGGRPTIYTEELGDKICKRIADGESLKKIGEDNKMPDRSTLHDWILNREQFSHKYEKAVNVRTENMADDLNDIADNKDGEVQRDRLRVDTRKWYLSKIVPKKYGDKLDLTSKGEKLPTPIIPLDNVLRNDSNSKDNNTEQKD